MDQAGIISPQTKTKLEALLRRVNDSGALQLQVLTVSTLDGLPIEQASIEIVEKWQLGTKEKDNGVLFLIAPQDRKMRIEVGQGVEGDLPDVIAKRIIAEIVAPAFRQGLFDEGISAGVVEIIRYAAPQVIGEKAPPREQERSQGIPIFVFLLFFVIVVLQGAFGRRMGIGRTSGWGPGGFGGGGFGGGGGGGWSGGGGGFSGGGASGNW